MSSIWKRSDGKIIKNEDGKILVCDDCPCGGCPGQPSSFAAQVSDGFGISNGTITLNAPLGVLDPDFLNSCWNNWSIGFGTPAAAVDCWWFGELGTVGSPARFPRLFLYVSTIDRGSPPEWTITWGHRLTVPSIKCNLVGDSTQAVHNDWTVGLPTGTYTGSGGATITIT